MFSEFVMQLSFFFFFFSSRRRHTRSLCDWSSDVCSSDLQYCNARNLPNFVAPDLPSDYLCSRCPCCFGGSAAAASGLQVDCIVSLDANFQLKRIWDYDQCAAFRGQKLPGSQDPKMTSPLT